MHPHAFLRIILVLLGLLALGAGLVGRHVRRRVPDCRCRRAAATDCINTTQTPQMLRAPANEHQAEQLTTATAISTRYVITFTDRGMANVNDDVSSPRAHGPDIAPNPCPSN